MRNSKERVLSVRDDKKGDTHDSDSLENEVTEIIFCIKIQIRIQLKLRV